MDEILFSFKTEIFTATDVPFYIGLGILCGFLALLVTHTHYIVEGWIGKIGHPYRRAIVGGLLLGIIMLIFPPIYKKVRVKIGAREIIYVRNYKT